MQWITGSSLFSALLVVVLGLICWHWLESGESFNTGVQMAWQDAKVATSCRSVSATYRFVIRHYEDYQEDRRLFSAPGWKHFICEIYDSDAERTSQYRTATIQAVYDKLPPSTLEDLKAWLDARNLEYDDWKNGKSADQ